MNDLESVSLEQPVVESESGPIGEIAEEAKEEVVQEEKKEQDLFSKKFAALSKKEKLLRQREVELNSRMAELEQKFKNMEAPKVEEVKKSEIPLEERLKRNPLQTLSELGLDYQALTDLALNDGKQPIEKQIEFIKEELDSKYKSEIEALRAEMLEKEKAKEQEKYDQVNQQFLNDLTNFVNDTEDYELIRANDSVNLVFDVIVEHYNKSGKILSNKEAADLVESHLFEEAQKLLKLKKLGNLVKPKQETQQPIEKKLAQTLSNEQTTLVPQGNKRPLSKEESLAAAAAKLRWTN